MATFQGVVQFRSDVNLPYDKTVESLSVEAIFGDQLSPEIGAVLGTLRVRPHFRSVDPRRIAAMEAQARSADRSIPVRALRRYYEVTPRDEARAPAWGTVRSALLSSPNVELAYHWPTYVNASAPPYGSGPEPTLDVPDTVNLDPCNCASEVAVAYHDGAPSGIGLKPFRTHRPLGSWGAGVRLGVVEKGFWGTHCDLRSAPITDVYGDISTTAHGTATMGVLVAQRNGMTMVGCCPEAKEVILGSPVDWTASPPPFPERLHDAFLAVASEMKRGDVMLIEFQFQCEIDAAGDYALETCSTGINLLPVEVVPDMFSAIQVTTRRGVTVVEPAGNAGASLDRIDVLRRGDTALDIEQATAYVDSGAVLVAAAKKSVPHVRLTSVSNYGSRVDCFAWGEEVQTLGQFNDCAFPYIWSGTSSASAIVAGAAGVLQGWALHRYGAPIQSQWRVRKLLRNSVNTKGYTDTTGTTIDRTLGVMPNLRRLYRRVRRWHTWSFAQRFESLLRRLISWWQRD